MHSNEATELTNCVLKSPATTEEESVNCQTEVLIDVRINTGIIQVWKKCFTQNSKESDCRPHLDPFNHLLQLQRRASDHREAMFWCALISLLLFNTSLLCCKLHPFQTLKPQFDMRVVSDSPTPTPTYKHSPFSPSLNHFAARNQCSCQPFAISSPLTLFTHVCMREWGEWKGCNYHWWESRSRAKEKHDSNHSKKCHKHHKERALTSDIQEYIYPPFLCKDNRQHLVWWHKHTTMWDHWIYSDEYFSHIIPTHTSFQKAENKSTTTRTLLRLQNAFTLLWT